jgi:hypothetical protein
VQVPQLCPQSQRRAPQRMQSADSPITWPVRQLLRDGWHPPRASPETESLSVTAAPSYRHRTEKARGVYLARFSWTKIVRHTLVNARRPGTTRRWPSTGQRGGAETLPRWTRDPAPVHGAAWPLSALPGTAPARRPATTRAPEWEQWFKVIRDAVGARRSSRTPRRMRPDGAIRDPPLRLDAPRGWNADGTPVPTAMAATSSRAYLLLRYRACTPKGPCRCTGCARKDDFNLPQGFRYIAASDPGRTARAHPGYNHQSLGGSLTVEPTSAAIPIPCLRADRPHRRRRLDACGPGRNAVTRSQTMPRNSRAKPPGPPGDETALFGASRSPSHIPGYGQPSRAAVHTWAVTGDQAVRMMGLVFTGSAAEFPSSAHFIIRPSAAKPRSLGSHGCLRDQRPSPRSSKATAPAAGADGENSAAAATSGWRGPWTSGPAARCWLSTFIRRTPESRSTTPAEPSTARGPRSEQGGRRSCTRRRREFPAECRQPVSGTPAVMCSRPRPGSPAQVGPSE